MVLHEEIKHNGPDINLRYRPRWLPKVIIIVFTFWYRSIGESFLYAKICFIVSTLPSSGSKKSAVYLTLTVHDTEPLP